MTSSIDRAKKLLEVAEGDWGCESGAFGGDGCSGCKAIEADRALRSAAYNLLRGYIGAIETMEMFAIFHASSCPEAHQGGKCDCRVGAAERAIVEFDKLFPE